MIIPKRLFGPAQLANAAATVYTVAAGRRGIIRHIHVTNPSAGTTKITIDIGTDAAAKRIFDQFPLTAGQILDHPCYYTLEAAEIIQAFSDTATTNVMVISGDEQVLT